MDKVPNSQQRSILSSIERQLPQKPLIVTKNMKSQYLERYDVLPSPAVNFFKSHSKERLIGKGSY